MNTRNFHDLLRARWAEGKFVCVGLDSDVRKMPRNITQHDFNFKIIDATCDLVCAYKPNMAFYEAMGTVGYAALGYTIEYIHRVAPGVPIILDAKRGDIGNTNEGYIEAAFEWFEADAITISPFLGQDAMQPFLDRKERGIFVLCRTSNKGAGEFQDLICNNDLPLYLHVAERVAKHWNANGNCGLVAGATASAELVSIRHLAGDMPILIPGIGAQGGDLNATIQVGQDSRGQGMIINASRSIIFASSGPDFAEAAHHETQKLHDQITQILKGE